MKKLALHFGGIFSLVAISLINFSFSQEIKLFEENQFFNIGSKNSIVISIPYGVKDIVEREIKRELKDWDGKYDSDKGEFFTIQASTKAMGGKPFDAYAKIIVEADNSMKVAFAIDLGGAFLSSREHVLQYKAMSEMIKDFAKKASLACIDGELDVENKVLSGLEKDLRSLEKDKEKLAEDIEDYKKKILEAERKTETNIKEQDKNKDSIKKQVEKLFEVEKRKKSLK